MKLCIDWQAVHQDWLASGLSKNRYFLSDRIEKFIREDVAPCKSTFLRHLRVLEKGQAISQESSACVTPLVRQNLPVAGDSKPTSWQYPSATSAARKFMP